MRPCGERHDDDHQQPRNDRLDRNWSRRELSVFRRGYEPGEYCQDSDQGVTGQAGDGKAITCENNDGLRWEPT
jgi:hypothetical protein